MIKKISALRGGEVILADNGTATIISAHKAPWMEAAGGGSVFNLHYTIDGVEERGLYRESDKVTVCEGGK